MKSSRSPAATSKPKSPESRGERAPNAPPYNAALDLIERNLTDRADKTAFIDAKGAYTFGELSDRVDRIAKGYAILGLKPGDRLLLCLMDQIDLVAGFLAAMKSGILPIPVNTLLSVDDYAYILEDSGSSAVAVSAELLPIWRAAMARINWTGAVIVGGDADGDEAISFARFRLEQPPFHTTYKSQAQEPAFWLYSSGSTGKPKGVVHRHSSPVRTAELFAQGVLGLNEHDVVLSAAKLFFAYGLGNALTFPMAVGATAVLHPGRATPEVMCALIEQHEVSVFFGVPTLYASMLASPHLPNGGFPSLRLCVSAGEALPESLARAWTERTGVEIIDGIGSTEMLHIYVSNRPGAVRYGTTGTPTPGYKIRLLSDDGCPAAEGDIGELHVRGPSVALAYWNNAAKTAETFQDGWMRTGDKFFLDAQGALVFAGRGDDMLKVSGKWVSPSEVENALVSHPDVQEAAVIGAIDRDGLVKTKAFVVARSGVAPSDDLGQALKTFVKARLASHKYPRSIKFVSELPKTATGKIRRHLLRERQAASPQAVD